MAGMVVMQGANILVDNNGQIKLADFGASKKLADLVTIKCPKQIPYCASFVTLPSISAGSSHLVKVKKVR